jgi:hypothetical protein
MKFESNVLTGNKANAYYGSLVYFYGQMVNAMHTFLNNSFMRNVGSYSGVIASLYDNQGYFTVSGNTFDSNQFDQVLTISGLISGFSNNRYPIITFILSPL